MDYDSPQFIAAVKKITNIPLGAMADALHAIANGLQQQNEAIREQTRAHQDARYAQRRVITELKIPQAEKYKQETNTAKESFIKWGTLYAEAIGIIVVIAYTTVAAFQLHEMVKQYPELHKSAEAARSAAETASDALVVQQIQWRRIAGEPVVVLSNLQLCHDRKGIFVDVTADNVGSPKVKIDVSIASNVSFVKPTVEERQFSDGDFKVADDSGDTSRNTRKRMTDSTPPSRNSKLYIWGAIRYSGEHGRHYADVPFCKSTLAQNVLDKRPLNDDDTFPTKNAEEQHKYYKYNNPPHPFDPCDEPDHGSPQ